MKMDGVTLLAIIVIGSFAIERFTNGVLFFLALFKWWRRVSPDPTSLIDPTARAAAERRHTLIYFVLAFALGLVLTGFGNLRVLNAVGLETKWFFDVFLTALILVGGADRVAELLKVPGARGGTLSHLKQDNVRGNPYKSPISDSAEEMFDRFGLDPDSRLALIVERSVPGTCIVINSPCHDATLL